MVIFTLEDNKVRKIDDSTQIKKLISQNLQKAFAFFF